LCQNPEDHERAAFRLGVRSMISSISVIIATYTRAALLDECLQHLSKQRFFAEDEVIVVDNASADDTPAVVRQHQATFPVALRLLYESQPGKSPALARGLAVAKGEILAFLDDDVNVGAGWLDAVRDTMRESSVGLMGGRVVPRWEPGVPDWVRRAPFRHARLGAPLGLLEYSTDVVDLGPRTALGGNMAVRRHVFDVVGGFAAHLGKLRGTLLSGEDHELCVRVQRAGFRAIYVRDAVVHHWVPAERARTSYFLHWFYWSGITHAIMDAEAASKVRPLPALYLVKRAMLGSLRVLRALATGRRTTALSEAIDVAFVAGYLAHRLGLSPRQHAGAKQVMPRAA
jgi:glucosyl-dolichyl phosphate glucuronosyltransferase